LPARWLSLPIEGKTERAAVDALVAPTAPRGLDQALSWPAHPTVSEVPEVVQRESGRATVLLEFWEAVSQNKQFTLTIEVDAGATTITAIDPRNMVES
jgi:hypothetical protein